MNDKQNDKHMPLGFSCDFPMEMFVISMSFLAQPCFSSQGITWEGSDGIQEEGGHCEFKGSHARGFKD